jgi:hypothetical protein
VPVVMVCVGVPWDAVLQSMLHAALGGGAGGEGGGAQRLGKILTLDVSVLARRVVAWLPASGVS